MVEQDYKLTWKKNCQPNKYFLLGFKKRNVWQLCLFFNIVFIYCQLILTGESWFSSAVMFSVAKNLFCIRHINPC